MEFTHLHLHTQYSALDGAIKIKELMPRLKKLGMGSCAITDHGTMAGVVQFYKHALANNIKPILGMEAYVAQKSRHDRKRRKAHHLVLLASTNEGFDNLRYLSSEAYKTGFYYKPRIDKDLLKRYSKGIIGLSGCLGGSINSKIIYHGIDAAVDHAGYLADCFDSECFYLELQVNEYERQKKCNDGLMEIAERLGLPLVATADCHYLEKSDAAAHEILMCMNMRKTLSEYRAGSKHSKELFVKSPTQMKKQFEFCPSAIDNTQIIMNKCNVELDLGNVYMPKFNVPKNTTEEKYFRKLARDGLKKRIADLNYKIDEKKYFKQLEYELDVIIEKKYSDYFLVCWDFVKFAKQNKISVGPGRGSGAGCIIAWAMGITNLDPIYHQLVFERFLNPERASSPDFDIDFDPLRRDDVIKYVKDKYGDDHVAQIATYSTLSAKSAIKDVGKVLGFRYDELNKITNSLPNLINGKPITVKRVLEEKPELKDNKKFNKLLEIAEKLSGLFRQTGTHACGIVIGEKPINQHVPTCKVKLDNLVTQFDKNDDELCGLVKFDFLGLKTLTVITDASSMVRASVKDFDIEKIPINDDAVFKTICDGNTDGIFQLESDGMKKLLSRLKPDRFEDLSAVVALYRPGPLNAGMTESFVLRKNGKEEITYPHQKCEHILSNTYGVIVYQEQVMQIACELCGWTLGRADALRKAMGKKKPEVMAALREEFIDGAYNYSKMPKHEAEELFLQIEKFAGYAFNKAHTAAYAWIGYQTAYLKTYYPAEFMAALLTDEIENQDNVVKYIENCKDMRITILPPNINKSGAGFVVEGDCIRFGLAAIKGVGFDTAKLIAASRDCNAFKSVFDFCGRLDHYKVSAKLVRQLIYSGAFDVFGHSRSTINSLVDSAIIAGRTIHRTHGIGQMLLFDGADNNTCSSVPEWSQKKILAKEKDSIGFYLSGHPLDGCDMISENLTNMSVDNLTRAKNVTLLAVVESFDVRPYKSGNGVLGVVTLSNKRGSCKAIAFNDTVNKYRHLLQHIGDTPLLFHGEIKEEYNNDNAPLQMYIRTVSTVHEALNKIIKILYIDIKDLADIKKIKGLIEEYPGDKPVVLIIRKNISVKLSKDYRVSFCQDFFERFGHMIDYNRSLVPFQLT